MSEPVKLPVVLPFDPSDIVLAALVGALEHPLVRFMIAVAAIAYILKLFAPAGTKKQSRRDRRYRPSYQY